MSDLDIPQPPRKRTFTEADWQAARDSWAENEPEQMRRERAMTTYTFTDPTGDRTIVSADEYDRLVAELDAPAVPNDALREAAKRAGAVVPQQDEPRCDDCGGSARVIDRAYPGADWGDAECRSCGVTFSFGPGPAATPKDERS